MRNWFKKYFTPLYSSALVLWTGYMIYSVVQTDMPAYAVYGLCCLMLIWCSTMLFEHFHQIYSITEIKTLELLKQILQITEDFEKMVDLHNAFVNGYNELDDAKGRYAEDNVYVKIQKPHSDPKFFYYMKLNYETIAQINKKLYDGLDEFKIEKWWQYPTALYRSRAKHKFVLNQKIDLETKLSKYFKKFIVTE